MKKLAASLLIGTMVVSMVGCAGSNNSGSNTPAPAPAAKYIAGTYRAYSDSTDKGYTWAEVTIKDDKISEVKLGGTNGFGDEKPESYPHQPYHQGISELPAKFVAANSSKVDVITGATGSSNQWMQAVERALENGLAKKESQAKYFDGVYMGASDQTEKGRGVVLVTVKDDKITEVVVKASTFTKEETPKEVFKDENYAYEAFHKAVDEMPAKFVAANSSKVDIVTGATSSSNQWMQGVERALEKAKR